MRLRNVCALGEWVVERTGSQATSIAKECCFFCNAGGGTTMKSLVYLTVMSAFLFAATSAFAADQDKTKDQSANPSATQSQAASKPNQPIRHMGHWWFQTKDQQWLVWQNNAWAPYKAGMFAGQSNRTATRSTRRYAYEPQMQTQRGYYPQGYPRMYRAPGAFGSSRSIRYAGSKANFDYAPYTGGTVQ